MRNVVITGGSRGIGAECVKLFTKKGDRVFFIYEKNDAMAEMLAKQTDAMAIKADISQETEAERAVNKIHEYQNVDILVNNAGISQIKMFCDITASDWDRMFAVNMKGTFLMTKLLLPDMIHRKSGKIINVSSMWGQTGGSCEVHYSASKAAVIGFTKALAKELAPSGICVNCVAPGVIDTDMNKEIGEDELSTLKDEIPLMRMGTAKEVAEVIYALSQKTADYITGQVVGVNGGMVI